MRLGAIALPPEEDPATGYQPKPAPILKTAPRVNGTTPTNGPTLAPNGNGGITPAFQPIDVAPMVHCVPGWTGPDCKTRISDLQPAGLPTGVDRAPPGSIVPSEVTRDANGAAPTYKIENGVPVRTVEAAAVEKGFLIGPLAIAAAATIGLVVLLRSRK